MWKEKNAYLGKIRRITFVYKMMQGYRPSKIRHKEFYKQVIKKLSTSYPHFGDNLCKHIFLNIFFKCLWIIF